MAHNDHREKWHVGREIPMATVIILLAQLGSFIWWASGLNSRVDGIERWIIAKNVTMDSDTERLARIDERVRILMDTITINSKRETPNGR